MVDLMVINKPQPGLFLLGLTYGELIFSRQHTLQIFYGMTWYRLYSGFEGS